MENSLKAKDNNVSKPTKAQMDYLRHGLDQAGGKLPLFDSHGKSINPKTIRACIDRQWAEPWFANPAKPDWLVCKLTDKGRTILAQFSD